MANLIRLKQIESGSSLQTSAQIGTDFSASVNNIVSQSIETTFSASIVNIITNNVAAVLPDGVVSGSSQIYISGTIGYNDMATDIEVAVISSSISASQVLISSSISSSIVTALSGSLSSITNLSSSVNAKLINLELTSASINAWSSSLDSTYATDAEVYVSQSNINIDMGEW